MIPEPIQLGAAPVNGYLLRVASGILNWGLLTNANVDAAAAIAITKIANGTADTVACTNGAGTAAQWTKIVNANVDNAAAVAVSKLAAGSNGEVLQTVVTTPTWTGLSAISPTSSNRNKNMAAESTAADFDEACATGISATPAPSTNTNGVYVGVSINGLWVKVGNAVKTKDCYFSGNAGVTARAFGAIVSGDKLYWVGSVAGYQLDSTTDLISFYFDESA